MSIESNVTQLPHVGGEQVTPILLRGIPVYPDLENDEEVLALVQPVYPRDLPEQWNGDWSLLRWLPIHAAGHIKDVCQNYHETATANMTMLPLLRRSVPADFLGRKYFIIANQFWQQGTREEFIVVLDVSKDGEFTQDRFRTDSAVPANMFILLFR